LSTADTAAQRPGAARRGLLARHPLLFCFIIAYAGSWLVEMPLVLSEDGAGLLPFSSPLPPLATIAVAVFAGPFLAAFIMTGVTEGRAGLDRLLGRIVLWRVGLRWYLFALVGIPVILVLSAVVLPGVLASFQTPALSLVLFYPVSVVLAFFIGGPLGEEPGWRGFALPRLQRQHGPLVGSLILGPIWALWHLPLFWWPGWHNPPTILNIVLYVLALTALTIVFTWVFNNAHGSVLMTMLLHASLNAFWVGPVALLFAAPIVTGNSVNVPVLIGFGVVALLVVALTRGRLGYQH
jgi:membrane protease YdiL (CAAX protease family)